MKLGWNKVYLVMVTDETYEVFNGNLVSMIMNDKEESVFEVSSNSYHTFARLNTYSPVTEREIAELLCEPDEELE